ncbi:hypothetical protein JZ751_028229, partial [Albula glossodonta]
MNGAAGESVMINTDIGSAGPFLTITWNFDGGSGPVPVVSVANGVPTEGPGYTNRVSVNTTTGSLELKQLTLGDSGAYTVSMVPNTGDALNGETTLNVYERISGALITGPSETLIAGKSSINMTCQAAAGTSISREWLKDDQPLFPSNRITFSEDNSTVFISPVESFDNGEYQCRLSNPVSTDTANYTLTVNYGPDFVAILGDTTAEEGSDLVLYCDVDSLPPAIFSWIVNGTRTEEQTAAYVIKNSSYSDSGNYTCETSNDITGNRVNVSHWLKITGKAQAPPAPPLTPGAAAGITIGVIAFVALLAVGVFFAVRHTRRWEWTDPETEEGIDRGAQHENGTFQRYAARSPSTKIISWASTSYTRKTSPSCFSEISEYDRATCTPK